MVDCFAVLRSCDRVWVSPGSDSDELRVPVPLLDSQQAKLGVSAVLSRYNIGNKAVYLIIANQLWFWSSMLTEAGIAATLSWRLWAYKGHTDPDGHPIELRVDNKVNRIVRCIVGSALPTAVFAVAGAVTYMATRWAWLYW